MIATDQPKMTVHTLKAFARSDETKSCVRSVLLAELFSKVERERVNAYILPLFELYTFEVKPEWRREGEPIRITNPDRLYLCDDEARLKEWYEECDKEHRKHGFTGPKGHCPALVAEDVLRQAQQLLIDHACASLPLGFDSSRVFGDARDKLLRLVISMTIQESPEEFTSEKMLRK